MEKKKKNRNARHLIATGNENVTTKPKSQKQNHPKEACNEM
jgi:hypothetical protein